MCTYSLSSAFRFALTRGYTTEKSPQADVLDVNQSPAKINANNNSISPTPTYFCRAMASSAQISYPRVAGRKEGSHRAPVQTILIFKGSIPTPLYGRKWTTMATMDWNLEYLGFQIDEIHWQLSFQTAFTGLLHILIMIVIGMIMLLLSLSFSMSLF